MPTLCGVRVARPRRACLLKLQAQAHLIASSSQPNPQQYRTTPAIMAPGQKSYPRATVKKIVKAHSGLNISKNADVLVRLPRAPLRVDAS